MKNFILVAGFILLTFITVVSFSIAVAIETELEEMRKDLYVEQQLDKACEAERIRLQAIVDRL